MSNTTSESFSTTPPEQQPPDEETVDSQRRQLLVPLESGGTLFEDIDQALNGSTELLQPTICARTDGIHLLYPGTVNCLYGEPESGKTWIALKALAQVLTGNSTGLVAFLDLDHNGALTISTRLLALGVTRETLSDPSRFLLCTPEDQKSLLEAVSELVTRRPVAVVIDSVGELIPMMEGNSNSADDFTQAHRRVATRLARAGVAVVYIDHVPKDPEKKKNGPIGTSAKRRAVGGALLRVEVADPFAPGKDGRALLYIDKDRMGELRRESDSDLIGIFEMTPHQEGVVAEIRPPTPSDVRTLTTAPTRVSRSEEALFAELLEMYPDGDYPRTQRGIQQALRISNEKAAEVARMAKDWVDDDLPHAS